MPSTFAAALTRSQMFAVFSSWRNYAHERSQHCRHVGHGLATIATNMLRSCMRHWQLAVAKQNYKFQANHTATCFHDIRIKMAAFHAMCQVTADRCKMRANQQTVLSALRLASENVPVGQLTEGYQKPSVPVFVAQFKAPWYGSLTRIAASHLHLMYASRSVC